MSEYVVVVVECSTAWLCVEPSTRFSYETRPRGKSTLTQGTTATDSKAPTAMAENTNPLLDDLARQQEALLQEVNRLEEAIQQTETQARVYRDYSNQLAQDNARLLDQYGGAEDDQNDATDRYEDAIATLTQENARLTAALATGAPAQAQAVAEAQRQAQANTSRAATELEAANQRVRDLEIRLQESQQQAQAAAQQAQSNDGLGQQLTDRLNALLATLDSVSQRIRAATDSLAGRIENPDYVIQTLDAPVVFNLFVTADLLRSPARVTRNLVVDPAQPLATTADAMTVALIEASRGLFEAKRAMLANLSTARGTEFPQGPPGQQHPPSPDSYSANRPWWLSSMYFYLQTMSVLPGSVTLAAPPPVYSSPPPIPRVGAMAAPKNPAGVQRSVTLAYCLRSVLTLFIDSYAQKARTQSVREEIVNTLLQAPTALSSNTIVPPTPYMPDVQAIAIAWSQVATLDPPFLAYIDATVASNRGQAGLVESALCQSVADCVNASLLRASARDSAVAYCTQNTFANHAASLLASPVPPWTVVAASGAPPPRSLRPPSLPPNVPVAKPLTPAVPELQPQPPSQPQPVPRPRMRPIAPVRPLGTVRSVQSPVSLAQNPITPETPITTGTSPVTVTSPLFAVRAPAPAFVSPLGPALQPGPSQSEQRLQQIKAEQESLPRPSQAPPAPQTQQPSQQPRRTYRMAPFNVPPTANPRAVPITPIRMRASATPTASSSTQVNPERIRVVRPREEDVPLDSMAKRRANVFDA